MENRWYFFGPTRSCSSVFFCSSWKTGFPRVMELGGSKDRIVAATLDFWSRESRLEKRQKGTVS